MYRPSSQQPANILDHPAWISLRAGGQIGRRSFPGGMRTGRVGL